MVDLYRAIRSHLPSLIPGLMPDDISTMSLGLSHSLSRHKLKFSPDKVDTMIVQAIALLDDLDKELNTYAMRVKEWYGWHFPEMGKIVNDNLAYARVILKMGFRSSAVNADLAEILPEEIEGAVKAAAEVSMGTEITEEDLDNIKALAEQVVGFTEYRQQLSSYLSARMTAIAPNLTSLVGELVGARLIAHAGSLMNLAKSPASTIQILGAEKALFRALKTKHDTPKYGLIYHASLIGQATGKNKGKIARMLATKAALGLRVDALADWSANGEGKGDDVPEEEKSALGIESRLKIERRLRVLEGKPALSKGVSIGPTGKAANTPGKWEVKEARKYNPDADGLAGDEPAATATTSKKPKGSKKISKDRQGDIKMIEEVESDLDAEEDSDEEDDDGDNDKDEDMVEKVSTEDESEDDGEEEDEDMDEDEAEVSMPILSLPKEKPIRNTNGATKVNDERSNTIPTPSADTLDSSDSRTPQELKRQSSGSGKSKEAKKTRKAERHSGKLEMPEEKAAKKKTKHEKVAGLQDRKESKLPKSLQVERPADRDREVAEAAAKAGLSVSRYQRKLERGEIRFETDGTPVAISKKEIKKLARAEAKLDDKATGDTNGKKRKREEDAGKESKSKKKKKSKA